MSTNSTFCDQCGKPTLRGTSKFCSSCGAELPTLPLGDTPRAAAEDTHSSATEPPGGFEGGEVYRGRPGSRGAGRWIRRQQRQQRRDARSESVGDTPTTGNEESGSDVQPSTDKKQESGWFDNPLTFIGLSLFFVGWVWAVVICFNHSAEWLIRGLSIFTAPFLMLWWGEWAPLLIVVPGWVIWIVGQVFGRRPTFWRMSFAVVCMLSIYFLPFGVGLLRNKREKVAIFLLNIFGGWTGLLWIVALVWASIPRRNP